MSIYIGVDGGGTSTTFVAVNAACEVLAECSNKSTNFNSVGVDNATKAVTDGIMEVVRQCNYTLEDVAAICCAMSGCNSKKDAEVFESMARSVYPPPANVPIIHAYNDSVGALASGTMGVLHGVVLIAGTGMIGYGRNESDSLNAKEWVAGGNGCLVDSGSGYMLGMDAIRAAFAAADGMGPSTLLLNSVLSTINAKEASEIVPWLYQDHEWGRIAALGRLVFDAVDENDEVALNILKRHAEYLVRSATTIIKRLEYNPKETLVVVLNGGLFNYKLFFQLVNDGIVAQYPFVQCILPKVNPAHGAALLAKQQAEKK